MFASQSLYFVLRFYLVREAEIITLCQLVVSVRWLVIFVLACDYNSDSSCPNDI